MRPVLGEAISITKSGGLPWSEITYAFLRRYASGSTPKATSRSGYLMPAMLRVDASARYRSPATSVVSGFPRWRAR